MSKRGTYYVAYNDTENEWWVMRYNIGVGMCINKENCQVFADRLNALEQDIADYKEGAAVMRMSISDLRRERDELDQIVADLRRQLVEAKAEAYDEYESTFLDFIDDDLSSMVDIDKWPKAIRALIPKEESDE